MARNITIYGVGQIAPDVVKYILANANSTIKAAVDIDTNKIGQDLGRVIGLEQKIGVDVISPEDFRAMFFYDNQMNVGIHMTGSRIAKVKNEIQQLLRKNHHVVSSCEEMAHLPYLHHKEYDFLKGEARVANRVIVGTGVNPGLLMDRLAIQHINNLHVDLNIIQSVSVQRIVDASKRRQALQAKVGSGLTQYQFYGKKRHKTIGHVGLIESAILLAEGLGWKVEDYEERLKPVIATEPYETEYFKIEQGLVRGMRHQVTVEAKNAYLKKCYVNLDLLMAIGEQETGDWIDVFTDYGKLRQHVIEPCLDGDKATALILANFATTYLKEDDSGVKTVLDYPTTLDFPWLN